MPFEGYIALKSDINTIKGAVFDHKANAGLGAETFKMVYGSFQR